MLLTLCNEGNKYPMTEAQTPISTFEMGRSPLVEVVLVASLAIAAATGISYTEGQDNQRTVGSISVSAVPPGYLATEQHPEGQSPASHPRPTNAKLPTRHRHIGHNNGYLAKGSSRVGRRS